MVFDYLIIGSGIAGISAVETLRKFNKEATIGLISNEPHDPYSKVLLPFYLKGKIKYDQLFIRGKNFWQKNNIEFICAEVVSLDRSVRKVTVKGGQEIFYKKLLIASGASAKKLDFLGNDLPGAFYFRDLAETIKIKDYLDKFQVSSFKFHDLKPVIYGASFIALEFAGIFAYFGIPAKIIFRGPYFWSRLLDEAGGKLIENFLEQAGMEIHKNEEIKSARPVVESSSVVIASSDASVGAKQSFLQKIITTKTEYGCNLLGLGVGLEPNLNFVRAAGFKVNHGIVTDEFLQTSDPDIFAAGDVAEFYDIVIGRHHVLGNWLNSEMQGRTAAMNMLGAKKSFELVSFYNFNFDGLSEAEPRVASAARLDSPSSARRAEVRPRQLKVGSFNICALGDTNPSEPFDTEISSRSQKYIKVLIKNNQCIGFVLVNCSQLREKCINFIKNKLEPARLDSLLDL